MVGTRFQFDSVGLSFEGKAALDSVSIQIGSGEVVAFVGPSGSGKTSALRMLNGAVRPSTGEVHVDSNCLAGMSGKELKQLRTEIGFVHQDLDLIPNLRVAQNVLAGRLGRRSFFGSLRTMIRPSRAELTEVHKILSRVGIPEKIFQRTDRLSGGQRQRVAIARAMYQQARALLIDEPVSSLDPARSRDAIDLLTSLAEEHGLTLVASMHDIELAREFFPRLIGLRHGQVRFDGSPDQIDPSEFEKLYQLDAEEMLADDS